MATIELKIVAGQTFTNTRTVSAAHLVRVANALRAYLGKPGATDDEIFSAWADSVYQNLRNLVRGVERDSAAVSVSDITLT